MIKRAAIAMVLCLAATPAWAQTDTLVGIRSGSIELGAAGGLSIPVGDYGDVAARSGTGAVLLGYYASPQLSFGLDVGGHWHGASVRADSLQTASLGQSGDLSFHVYRLFTPYLKYQFKMARVSPYAVGLLGVYLQELTWTPKAGSGAESKSISQGYFGGAAGLGVQMVSDDNVIVFLEGRFHNAMRSDAAPLQFVDVRAGLTFLL